MKSELQLRAEISHTRAGEVHMSLQSDRSQGFWCVEHFHLSDALTPQELEDLRRYIRSVEYHAGEVVYFPGDPSDAIYTLHRGRVRLAYIDESGRRLTLAIMTPGQLFGEMALAGEQKRRWIAETLEDSILCIVHKQDFLRLTQSNPKLTLRITSLLGERLVQIENKLEDLLFKGVHARLARTLLRLAEQYGEQEADGVRIRFRLTHEELAHLIGSTRETTSLTLGELERQGLLSKQRGVILLKDLERLKQLT
jgi:CRP/FNR family cyclic AMP-dependent transcriptional regulator